MTRYGAITVLHLVLLTCFVISGAAVDAGAVTMDGDPAFYVDFGEDTHDVVAGLTYTWTLGPTNFGFVSGTCTETDTFCLHVHDTAGWTIVGDPSLGECQILDPGYLWWNEVTVTVPCEVVVCDYDTVIAVMAFCDDMLLCRPDAGDCEDPNIYDDNLYYSIDTVILHVVETPPSLYILQDSLYYVEKGQSAAHIPFSVCNGDPCVGTVSYSYEISSTGHIGGGFPQGDTIDVDGGECEDVYGIVDASAGNVCDFDTLTIIAWDTETATAYDTCVQIVHLIEM